MGYEYKVDIAGVTYYLNDLYSVSLTQPLFDKLSVGNACAAELDISLWPVGTIPKMAQITPYCRLSGTNDPWYQLGIFFIDTRSRNGDLLDIVAYDCMLKAEIVWYPSQYLEFPMTMEAAAREIASLMGTSLDPRCAFNGTYFIDYPANDYTLRDVLRFIAGAHVGNWIVTNKGQLLLIPLGGEGADTHYLVTENGEPITLGGVRILI